ncbi:MAG: ribbon-helix-helix domain-containing protein [Bacteriovorax sp.]|nr:ribbon-helix-helix domain-containing protein [Bacteriovorax sp.]
MAHINFKLDDELIKKINEEAERTGVNKSEFYRACLENGFDNITEYKSERKQVLVSFYIEEEMYKKLLQITKKYKLKMQKTYFTVFETGFDVLLGLKFLGFMKIVSGILKVEELLKKFIK